MESYFFLSSTILYFQAFLRDRIELHCCNVFSGLGKWSGSYVQSVVVEPITFTATQQLLQIGRARIVLSNHIITSLLCHNGEILLEHNVLSFSQNCNAITPNYVDFYSHYRNHNNREFTSQQLLSSQYVIAPFASRLA